jgi:hypothetical protein
VTTCFGPVRRPGRSGSVSFGRARIGCTPATGEIRTKDRPADWVLERVPNDDRALPGMRDPPWEDEERSELSWLGTTTRRDAIERLTALLTQPAT